MGILDFLFPKYCVVCKKLGSYLCENCFSKLSFSQKCICLVCGKASINELTHPGCLKKYVIDGAFSSINYNKIAKKLIYVFKYKPFVTDLSSILIDLFYENLIQNEVFYKICQSEDEFILLPIPLHDSRLRQRGYNQSEILAKGLAEKFKFKHLNLLERTKNTHSQVGLKREEREENIKGAFQLKIKYQESRLASEAKWANIKNSSIFLVDDVLTTGSTLLEAANVLKRNGVKKVYGLTFARD